MQTIIIIATIIITVLFIWIIIELRKSKQPQQNSEAMGLLLQNMNQLRESLDEKVSQSSRVPRTVQTHQEDRQGQLCNSLYGSKF